MLAPARILRSDQHVNCVFQARDLSIRLLALTTPGMSTRPEHDHVQCVPESQPIPTFAQVTAFPPEVCKIVGVRLPRFESWICHAKAQVSAGRTSRLPVFWNGAPDRRLTVQHAVQAGQR